MRISQLLSRLTALQAEHGDIFVEIDQDIAPNGNLVASVRVEHPQDFHPVVILSDEPFPTRRYTPEKEN